MAQLEWDFWSHRLQPPCRDISQRDHASSSLPLAREWASREGQRRGGPGGCCCGFPKSFERANLNPRISTVGGRIVKLERSQVSKECGSSQKVTQ